MPGATALPVLLAISFCHLLNDMMQALLPAMYPMLKSSFALDFTQIGLITLTFQLTASLLQPLIGAASGVFFRDEEISLAMVIGGIGILIGVAIIIIRRPGVIAPSTKTGI